MRLIIACLLFVPYLGAADNVLTEAEKTDGWKLLFDGTTTTGWVNRGKDELANDMKNWKADNGVLVRSESGGDAVYASEQFENFILSLEWKIADSGNSGVFVRLSDIKDWVNSAPEIQIHDVNARKYVLKPPHQAGALYGLLAPPESLRMKPGEWNHFMITCNGPHITALMNGQQTFALDLTEEKWQSPQGKFKRPYATLPRKGYIMLQDHGAEVAFKNIKIKLLP
jgi:Domain of Unknown Function (DUF1080)